VLIQIPSSYTSGARDGIGIGWIGRRSTAHITRHMVLGCTPVPVAVWCATTVQGPAAADWSTLLYSLATAVPVLRLLYSVPASFFFKKNSACDSAGATHLHPDLI